MKRFGVVTVNLNYLQFVLRFPDGHAIEYVLPAEPEHILHRVVRLVVSGPTLPVVARGERPPDVELRINDVATFQA